MTSSQSLKLAAVALVLIGVSTASFAQEDKIVAKVGGEPIYLKELEAILLSLPDQYRQVPLENLYEPLLQRAVQMHVLAMEGERTNMEESDSYKFGIAAAHRQLLEQATIASMLEEKLTDELVRARYQTMVDTFVGAEEIRARHILVEEEATANEIIAELDGGSDFAEVAKEKSTGPSGPNGGDLGFLGKGQMVPPFEEAAFALEAGQRSSAPVQTQFGWHVIKVEEKRETAPPSLEQVRPQLSEEIARELEQEFVEGLVAEADLELYDLQGNLIEQ